MVAPVSGGSGGTGEGMTDFRLPLFELFSGHGRFTVSAHLGVGVHHGEGVEESHWCWRCGLELSLVGGVGGLSVEEGCEGLEWWLLMVVGYG
jgi:hypothetical protein